MKLSCCNSHDSEVDLSLRISQLHRELDSAHRNLQGETERAFALRLELNDLRKKSAAIAVRNFGAVASPTSVGEYKLGRTIAELRTLNGSLKGLVIERDREINELKDRLKSEQAAAAFCFQVSDTEVAKLKSQLKTGGWREMISNPPEEKDAHILVYVSGHRPCILHVSDACWTHATHWQPLPPPPPPITHLGDSK